MSVINNVTKANVQLEKGNTERAQVWALLAIAEAILETRHAACPVCDGEGWPRNPEYDAVRHAEPRTGGAGTPPPTDPATDRRKAHSASDLSDLPAYPRDLLTDEEQHNLNDALTRIARNRRTAEATARNIPLA